MWTVFALFSFLVVAEGAGCTFSTAFTSKSDNCEKDPEAWREIDSVQVEFTCQGWDGYTMELSVRRSVSWEFDKTVAVRTIECKTSPCSSGVLTVSIPLSLRTCHPDQFFYWSLTGNSFFGSTYESCLFLPHNFNKGLTCDAIVSPNENTVVYPGPTLVEWTLYSPDDWEGKDLEVYLYREVEYLPDGWWFLGNTEATNDQIGFDVKTLNVLTTDTARWYVAAYYRKWYLFTVLVAQSQYFTIKEQNPNDWICGMYETDDEWRLSCCDTLGYTTNDLCRVGTSTDIEFEMKDLQFAVSRGPDMCKTEARIRGTPTIYYTNGDQVYSISVPLEKTYALADLLDQDLLSIPVLDSGMVTGLPADVAGADASLELSLVCENNNLGLKISLVIEAQVVAMIHDEVENLALVTIPGIDLPVIPFNGIASSLGTNSSVPTPSARIPVPRLPCATHANCSAGEYCDNSQSCSRCAFVSAHCDSVDDNCCSADFRLHCPNDTHNNCSTPTPPSKRTCTRHEQCPVNEFCANSTSLCTSCSDVTKHMCDAKDCCAETFMRQCPLDPHHCKDRTDCHACHDLMKPCIALFPDVNTTKLTPQQCACAVPWSDCIISTNCWNDHQVSSDFSHLGPLVPACAALSASFANPTTLTPYDIAAFAAAGGMFLVVLSLAAVYVCRRRRDKSRPLLKTLLDQRRSSIA